MMRLPRFRFHSPSKVSEVLRILSGEGADASVVAGGTDLYPNMKRRQQTPKTVISLRNIDDWPLKRLKSSDKQILGSQVTLDELSRDRTLRETQTALWSAASQVATPQIRNMATLGGNLCLDTRCNYYDQSYEWRKAIDFCMKKDGKICWVAPSSPRCWAVSSTDTAPAAIALGAEIFLQSVRGERTLPAEEFFADDGMKYLNKDPDELVSGILLPVQNGWRSTYWKLRRRGSFDFPVLSVAVAIKTSKEVVQDCRLVLGSIASRPVLTRAVSDVLIGKKLTDDLIEEAAELAWKPAKPMDNTDFNLLWRKKMVRRMIVGALNELKNDNSYSCAGLSRRLPVFLNQSL